MKKNIKRIFIFTTLVLLLVAIGAVSASDANDTQSCSVEATDSPQADAVVYDTPPDNSVSDDKNIVNEEKNVESQESIAYIEDTTSDNTIGIQENIKTIEKGEKTIKTDEEPYMVLEDINATVGATVTFKATIYYSEPVNKGKVTFKINGKTIKDENGKTLYAQVKNSQVIAEYVLPATYKVGNYTIVVTYPGITVNNVTIPRLNDSATLTIKYNTTTTISDVQASKGDTVTLTANSVGDTGSIAGTPVKFYVDDEEVGQGVIANGIATCEYAVPSSVDSGNHNLKAILEESTNYWSSEGTATLTVAGDKETIELISPTTQITSYAGSTLQTTLVFDHTLTDGTLEVYVNNEDTPRYTNSNLNGDTFDVEVDTSDLVAGTYPLTVKYTDSGVYSDSISDLSLVVNKLDTSIVVSDKSGFKADDIILTAVVSSTHGSTDGAVVKFYVDNQEVGQATVTEDIASYTYNVPASMYQGSHTIKAVVVADGNFETSEDTATLTVSKKTLGITVGDYTAVKGETITITPTFNDTVTDGKLYVAVDDSNIATINYPADSSSVEYDTSRLSTGSHRITLTYTISSIYENVNTATGTLTINDVSRVTLTSPQSAIESYVKQKAQTTLVFDNKLTDGTLMISTANDGMPIYFNMNLNDNSFDVDLNTNNLIAGEYPLVLRYYDSNVYEEYTTDLSLIVNKIDTSITTADKSGKINDKVQLTATVSSTHGSVDGATVKFYIDNQEVGQSTVSEATATYTYTIPSTLTGISHTIKAMVVSDDYYETSENTATLTLNKISTTTSVVGLSSNYKKYDTIQLTATVFAAGGANGATVKFYVNDEEVGSAVVSGSYATYSYTIADSVPVGQCTVKAVVVEDDVYSSSEGSTTFEVVKGNLRITIDGLYQPGSDFTVTITPVFNSTVSDGKLYVDVDGETKLEQDVSEGTDLTISTAGLSSGLHPVIVRLDSSDSYNDASSNQGNIYIKAKPKIKLNSPTASIESTVGDTTQTTLTFNSTLNDGKLEIFINNEQTPRYTNNNPNGKSFDVDLDISGLASGEYPLTVKYSGSSTYEDYTIDLDLILSKGEIEIIPESNEISVTKGDIASIMVNVNPIVTGNIIFKNGDDVIDTIAIENEGTATLNYDTTDLTADEYTINIELEENGYYEAQPQAVTLTVEAMVVNIFTDNAVSTFKNEDASISVNFDNEITDGKITVSNHETGEVLKEVENLNGYFFTVTVPTTNLNVGEYTLDVVYSDSQVYDDASSTVILTINKRLFEITVLPIDSTNQGETVEITIELNDTVSDGEFNLYIDNNWVSSISATDNPLTFTNVLTDDYMPGDHEVYVSYDGGQVFDESGAGGTLNINKLPLEITIENTDTYRKDPYVVVQLNDSVWDGTISLYLNGNEEAYYTEEDFGGDYLEIPINPDDVTGDSISVVVTYSNSNFYEDTTVSGEIALISKQLDMELYIEQINIGEIGSLEVDLNEQVPEGSWSIYVNGEEVNIIDMDADYSMIFFTFDASNAHIGDNELEVRFTDNQIYDDSSKTGTLVVKARENSIRLVYDPEVFAKDNASILVEFNEKPNDGILDVFVGTSTTPAATVNEFANEQIMITLDTSDYPAGNYNLQLKYHDSSIYNNISRTYVLTISKRKIFISPGSTSLNMYKGDKYDFTVLFNETVTDGKAELFIGNSQTPVATLTNLNGESAVFDDVDTSSYDLGIINFKIKYSGSQIHEDSQYSGQIQLLKRYINYTVDAATVAKGDKTSITITFNDTVNDGSLKVYVNDEQTPVRTVTQIDGTTVVISDIDTSTYNIGDNKLNVTFTGSALYENNVTISTLKLTKRSLDVTVEAEDVFKNDVATIALTLNDTVTDGTLEVFVDDETTLIKTISNPANVITIDDVETNGYAIGDRSIIVKYSGSELFDDYETTGILTVKKRDLDVTVDSVNVAKGDATTITLTLNDTISDGQINVYINDEITPIATITEFDETTIIIDDVDTSSYNVGDNNILVKYIDSEVFNDEEYAGILTLNTRTLGLTVTATEVFKGEDTTITISLNDTVNDGQLEVFIGDSQTPIKTIHSLNGDSLILLGQIDTSTYNIGDNLITVKYSGSSLYDDGQKEGILTLIGRDLGITVTADSVAKGNLATINVELNETVNDGTFNVYINDEDNLIATVESVNGQSFTLNDIDTSTYNIGENTIIVKYADSNLFANKESTGTLLLSKRDLNIDVTSNTVSKGDLTTITIELNETITDGTINVYIKNMDTPIATINEFDSKTITLNDIDTFSYDIGSNDILVKYSGSQLFDDTDATGTLVLSKRDLNIDVNAQSVAKGDKTTITLTLNDTLNDTLIDGQVSVYVNDVEVPIATITEFDGTTIVVSDVETSDYNIGDNTVTVKYADSELFNDVEATATLVLSKRDLDMTVDNQTVNKGDKTTITIELNDTVTDGSLSVYVNDVEVPIATITEFDGTTIVVADVETADYIIGDNTVTVKYADSELFNDKEASGTLTLSKRDLNIDVDAQSVAKADKTTITLTLNDTLTDGQVSVYVNDMEVPIATISEFDGTTIVVSDVETKDYDIGDNTVTVKYADSELFDDVESTATLMLSKRDLAIISSADSVAKCDMTTITIELNDTVSDGSLSVYVNDVEVPIATITEFDGTTVVVSDVETADYNVGDNTVIVKYAESGLFNDVEATAILTLSKRDLAIMPSADSVAKGDMTTITMELNDTVTDGSLSVYVNDVEVPIATITEFDGTTVVVADVETKDYNIGDNTVTVKYSGSELFNDVEATATLTLTARDLSMEVQAESVAKADKTTITVELNDTLTDGEISVYVNDVEVPIATITEFDGATVVVADVETSDYNIGDNTITVKYADSELFNDVEATGTLTLFKRDLEVTVSDITLPKGDIATITIELNDTVTDGIIEVFIGDSQDAIATITEFDGTTITINDVVTDSYAIGENTITVVYGGSELYNDEDATATLTLTNRQLTITTTATAVSKGDIATITIELNDTPTDGVLEVFINDEETPIRTIDSITSNVITIDDIETSTYNIGDNNVLVKYSGSQLYNDADSNANLVLTTRDLGITITADSVAKNDNASIIIELNETVTDGVIEVFIGEYEDAIKTITEFDGKTITINNIDTSNYNIGDNQIIVKYSESVLFDDTQATSTLTLTNRQLEITTTAVSVPKGDKTNIVIMLNDTPTDGVLEVFINDEQTPIKTYTEIAGKLIVLSNVDTSGYNIGDNNVIVKYSDSQLFDDATADTTLTLTDRQVEFTITADSVAKGDKTRIIIAINDTLTDGQITVYINDEEVPIKTITEFDSKLIIIDQVDTSSYNIGDNNIIVKYADSQLYSDTTANGLLTLTARDLALDVTATATQKGDMTTITIELNDTVTDGTLEVFVGENQIDTITEFDGTIITISDVDTSDYNIGDNTVTVRYSGSEIFNDATAEATLTLTARDLSVEVQAENVAKGDKTEITIELNDTVNDGKLEVFIGDSTDAIATITEFDGKTITLSDVETNDYNIGDNTVTVRYSGSELFNDMETTATLTLKARDLSIEAQAGTVAKGDKTSITITLNDTVVDGKLEVFVGDNQIATITEFDDTSVTIVDVDTDSYNVGDNLITVKYSDSNLFNEATTEATLTLTARELTMDIKAESVAKGDNTKVTITLNDTIKDGQIEIFVGDDEVPIATVTELDSNVIVVDNIDTLSFNIGDNDILVKYSGSQFYDEAQQTAILTLTTRDLNIIVDNQEAIKQEKTSITITLNDTPADGVLEVFIDDESTPIRTITEFDDNVIVIDNIDTSAYDVGQNNIIVKYSDSQLFNDAQQTATLTITNRQLNINVNALSTTKGDKTNIIIVLNETPTDGKLEVFIADMEVPIKTITEFNSNVIIIDNIETSEYAIGDNDVQVRYTGSESFADKTVDTILTLTSRQLEITADAQTVPKGDVTTITLLLNESITDGQIQVFINDETTPVRTISEFNSRLITLSDIPTGNYNIGQNNVIVKYTGSQLYSDSIKETTLTLTNRDLAISVEAQTVAKADTTTITVELNDTLTDGVLEVFIGDDLVATVTEFDGKTITIADVATDSYSIGDNAIVVRYSGSNLFNDASANGNLELVNRDLTITVDATTQAKGDTATITIVLNDTITDGTLEVLIGDNSIATFTEFDSTTITISDVATDSYEIGDNVITVKYSGSYLFNDADAEGRLTLTNRTLDVTVNAQEVFKLDPTTITITLNDTVTDGNIEVFINDKPVATITSFEDTIILNDIDTSDYNIGENTVTVKYTGSKLYSDSTRTATLILNKRNVDITVDAQSVAKGDVTTITIALNDTLTDGVIEVFLGENQTPVYTITEFDSLITIDNVDTSGYNVGENNIVVKYSQSELFNDNDATSTLTLTARDLTINVDATTVAKGDVTTITIALNDTPTDGILEVFIGDNQVATITDFDSTITIDDVDTSNYNVGENTITVKYTDSQTFSDATQIATLVLTKRDISINAGSINITMDVKSTNLTVTFNDTVNDGIVKVLLNGRVIGTYTIKDNTTSVDVKVYNQNLPIKETNITVNYISSNLYNDATVNSTLTTNKILTDITIDPIELNANRTVNITARITAVGSDTIVNEGKVTFKLNGKTLKDANGKVIYVKVVDGVATLEYSFGKFNSYNNLQITAVYAGSTAFNASRSEAVTVEKPSQRTPTVITVENMTAKVGDKITFNATVKDLDGNNVLYGKVIFKVNGETIKDVKGNVLFLEVVDGQVSVDYEITKLKAGNYTVTAVMGLDDFYNSCRTNAILKVEE